MNKSPNRYVKRAPIRNPRKKSNAIGWEDSDSRWNRVLGWLLIPVFSGYNTMSGCGSLADIVALCLPWFSICQSLTRTWLGLGVNSSCGWLMRAYASCKTYVQLAETEKYAWNCSWLFIMIHVIAQWPSACILLVQPYVKKYFFLGSWQQLVAFIGRRSRGGKCTGGCWYILYIYFRRFFFFYIYRPICLIAVCIVLLHGHYSF